jgi:uncharacterized membrane protein YphA (DoxX/SURF4 family)
MPEYAPLRATVGKPAHSAAVASTERRPNLDAVLELESDRNSSDGALRWGRYSKRVSRAQFLDRIGMLARLGLAAVWLVSGTLKAIDLDETVVAVRAYNVLPRAAVDVVAAVLPFLEIALGLLLLLGIGTRLVAVVSGALLLVYIAGVTQAWVRGLSIDCGCFGGGGVVAPGATAYVQEILRDVGFLALAAWLVIRPHTLLSMDARLTAGRT